MKKTAIAATLAVLMSASAQADVLGLYIGGQYWDTKASGMFGELGSLETFSLNGEKKGSFYVAIEHPIPLLPNVKLSSTNLDTTGDTVLSQDFKFGDVTFPKGTAVGTAIDLSFVDYTFYYELFSNDLFAFDFGLTARDTKVDTLVTSSGESATLKGSQIIPMLYASATIGLPLTGFEFFGQGNFLTVGDHTVYDYQAGIGYAVLDNLAVDLDVQLGYRAVSLKLEDIDDLSTDLKYDGVYLGAELHF